MLTFVRQPPPPTRPTTALTPPEAASAHSVRTETTDLDRLTSTRTLDSRQVQLLVFASAMRNTLEPRLSQTVTGSVAQCSPRSGSLRAA